MADSKTDLPEGTDKVIAGASTTSSPAGGTAVGSDTTLVKEKPVAGTGAKAGRSTGGSGSKTGSGGVMDKVRSGTDKLSGQAADKARDLVSQGIERSADALSNVSRLVGDTAAGLDERLGREYGDYARRAAEAIDGAATSLAAKDADELIDDTREFVRKSPGVALAGAAIVGFALARLIKTGLAKDDDNRSDV